MQRYQFENTDLKIGELANSNKCPWILYYKYHKGFEVHVTPGILEHNYLLFIYSTDKTDHGVLY